VNNFHFKKKVREAGFTMIELITVLAIIAIVSVMVFANYRSGNQQFTLENEAYMLAQNLRKVQEMAMSSKQISGVDPSGFGVYLKQGDSSYKLYADLSVPANNTYEATDYTVQNVTMAKYVYLKTVTPDLLSVNYTPPDPVTALTGNTGQVAQATIELGLEGTTKTQTVIVNRGGLIYVQ
jgi:type II secretion system protein H